MNEKTYPIHDALDNYKYRLKRNKVLRNPDKMTFDPEFAAIQYEHKMMLANTSLFHYLKYNTDAKFLIFMFVYLLVVAFSCVLLYLM
jgi:hypothetical protein